jgi:hypothetical protein
MSNTTSNMPGGAIPAGVVTSALVLTDHAMVVGHGGGRDVKTIQLLTDGQFPMGQTGTDIVPGDYISTSSITAVVDPVGATVGFVIAGHTDDTLQTVNAATGDIITIPLGAVAGTFRFTATVKAFEAGTPSSAGYTVYATLRTDGVAATLVGNQDVFEEDAVLTDADAYFIASGNNAVLQVLGVAGLTIDWAAECEEL